jgi:TolB protein
MKIPATVLSRLLAALPALLLAPLLSLLPAAPALAQGGTEFDRPSVLIPVYLGGTFNRHRVVVNRFQPVRAGGPLDENADLLPRRLAANLDMTGFFDLVDPRASMEADPRAGLAGGPPMDYGPWAQIGANLVVKGAIQASRSNTTLELYLFDIATSRQLLAKRYSGSTKDAQRMIARFTNDLLQAVTGEPGVFGSKIIFVTGERSNKSISMTELGVDVIEGVAAPKGGPNDQPTIGWGGQTAWTRRNGRKWELLSNGRVVHSGDTVFTPAYSPSGMLVAALSGRNSTNIHQFEGRGSRQLTSGGSIELSPTFSPDGRMAYVSNQGGGAGIYVSSGGGGGVRISPPGTSTDPSWSPRGDKIAFVYRERDICVMNPDGSGVMQLTNQGVNHHPSFSPDGRMIVFSSTRSGGSQLHVMSANGDRQQPLMLDGKGGGSLPSWSPVMPDQPR